jgi:pimeloyl-ACP methyl ester carboxylesterase
MVINFAAMKLSQRLALQYIRTKFKLLTAISKKKAAAKAFELFCTPQYRNKKKLPPVFEKGEKLRLTVDGAKINGWRFSPASNEDNTPITRRTLIIHGFESSVINFDRYVKPLTKKGYEVLAFDAPAHGRSPGKTITVIQYKKMIQAIHQQLGPVHSYIAHSFGGLALSLALEEMNHTHDYRVVLIAPASETITAINTFFKFLKIDPSIRPFFDTIILQLSNHSPEWFSIGRAMKNIKAKVLWLHDEADKVTPVADALKVKEQNHPHIEFVITRGLGHSRIYKDNKITNAIVEFL